MCDFRVCTNPDSDRKWVGAVNGQWMLFDKSRYSIVKPESF